MMPKIDVRLIVAAFGDRERLEGRAKVAKRILNAAGRGDIPIALGKLA